MLRTTPTAFKHFAEISMRSSTAHPSKTSSVSARKSDDVLKQQDQIKLSVTRISSSMPAMCCRVNSSPSLHLSSKNRCPMLPTLGFISARCSVVSQRRPVLVKSGLQVLSMPRVQCQSRPTQLQHLQFPQCPHLRNNDLRLSFVSTVESQDTGKTNAGS